MAHQSTWLFRLTVNLVKVVVSSWFVLVASTLGSNRLIYPQGYPDPFLAYEVLMTGQVVLDRGLCDAQWHDPVTDQTVCKIRPISGPFDEINVHACDCDSAELEIAFWSAQLRVADLVWRWGRPDTIAHDSLRYELTWEHQRLRAYTTTAKRYTLQTSVQLVTWRR